MAAQLDTPLLQEVVMTVEVIKAVEIRRVLLCRGLKTGAGGAVAATLCGILLKVADEGATGPVKMAEVRRVDVGAGAK